MTKEKKEEWDRFLKTVRGKIDDFSEAGQAIETWIEECSHDTFDQKQILEELCPNKDDRGYFLPVLQGCLKRRIKEGSLATGNKYGIYHKINADCEIIDFSNAPDESLPINMPMGIHDDLGVEIYEKDVIVIAGVSNHGKTAWILRFIEMNMREHNVWYFSSGDMSSTRLKRRMKQSGISLEEWTKYMQGKTIEIYGEFSDYVKPDDINVFDFMHEGEKAYLTANKMKRVKDKLQKGIAIIAIQKGAGLELGWGKETSRMYAQLYVTIDSGVAKVIKAKSWGEEKDNPNGKQFHFKLVNGFNFIPDKSNVGIWHRPDDLPATRQGWMRP